MCTYVGCMTISSPLRQLRSLAVDSGLIAVAISAAWWTDAPRRKNASYTCRHINSQLNNTLLTKLDRYNNSLRLRHRG